MDIISRLPDEILHYILSLSDLQMFDVVKLCVLSKRWNRLVATMPYLLFDLYRFYDWHSNAMQDVALFERLRNFIDWVLISRDDSSIVQFYLFSHNCYDSVQILRWLHGVAKRNVKEVDIHFDLLGAFKLPLFIATSESLEVLTLSLYYKVMHVPSHIKLDRLRQLDLHDVEFTDSASLERLVSGCRVLENLSLDYCMAKNFTSLHISSTCLKRLYICFHEIADIGNCDITVSCPCLTEFEYLAPVAKSCILRNASGIEYAQIYLMDCRDVCGIPKVGQMMYEMLKNFYSVTTLSLFYRVVPCLHHAIDEMLHCPITFHKVRSLTLDLSLIGMHTQVMFLLVDHCPNLEVLTLMCKEWSSSELDDEQWQLDHEKIVNWKSHRHLKTIELFAFGGDKYELDFLKFLLKNASTLEKLNITWQGKETCPSISKIVSNFSRASPNCRVKFQCPRTQS
ncbi:hypothetical protein LIER_01768 [Lithospermum erythrorhizon]|uniref:FBD domain-containing protein n=1 Tax=Lithospermum erythrorhizon TaxID=34254 RepID=A0AAV3NNC9_LITER